MKRCSNRKKRMIKQKIAGLVFILISLLPMIVIKDNKDLAYLIVTVPLGLFFIFTRDCYWID